MILDRVHAVVRREPGSQLPKLRVTIPHLLAEMVYLSDVRCNVDFTEGGRTLRIGVLSEGRFGRKLSRHKLRYRLVMPLPDTPALPEMWGADVDHSFIPGFLLIHLPSLVVVSELDNEELRASEGRHDPFANRPPVPPGEWASLKPAPHPHPKAKVRLTPEQIHERMRKVAEMTRPQPRPRMEPQPYVSIMERVADPAQAGRIEGILRR